MPKGEHLSAMRTGKGRIPGAGRVTGTPNKMTRNLKEMIFQALEEKGGVEYLKLQAAENPAAFLALVGKCLPRDPLPGSAENPFMVQHTLVKKLDISGVPEDQLDVLEIALQRTKMLTNMKTIEGTVE